MTVENLPKQFWRRFFLLKQQAISNYKLEKLNFEQNLNFFLFVFFFRLFTIEKNNYINYINLNNTYLRPFALQYHLNTVFSDVNSLENLSFVKKGGFYTDEQDKKLRAEIGNEQDTSRSANYGVGQNLFTKTECLAQAFTQQNIQDIFIYLFGVIINKVITNMYHSPILQRLKPRAK